MRHPLDIYQAQPPPQPSLPVSSSTAGSLRTPSHSTFMGRLREQGYSRQEVVTHTVQHNPRLNPRFRGTQVWATQVPSRSWIWWRRNKDSTFPLRIYSHIHRGEEPKSFNQGQAQDIKGVLEVTFSTMKMLDILTPEDFPSVQNTSIQILKVHLK